MATLEELEARMQRLTDIKEIERLQKIYGYYCDYFEFDKVVDLFSAAYNDFINPDRIVMGPFFGQHRIR